jgi:sulfur-oxidizing protein SoxB
MSYAIDVNKPIGSRISEMRLADGTPIEANKAYVVTGWASVNQGTVGPPIWDVVTSYLQAAKTVAIPDRSVVRVRGADPRGIAS